MTHTKNHNGLGGILDLRIVVSDALPAWRRVVRSDGAIVLSRVEFNRLRADVAALRSGATQRDREGQ